MAYTTINKPSDYFNTITWTADGTSPRSFTGVGFQPDLVWGKRRSVAADHNLYDVVRGAGSDKALMSNATSEEGNASASFGYLSSLDSDGFTTTTGSTNNNYWNNGTDTYVAWNWLAGGTASSNTDGSITSSVSANTTSGFSIVSYTGTGANATIGHGLGAVPKMIIVKDRDTSASWQVYHVSLGATKYLKLDTTDAEATNTNRWNDTEPTSSVFTVGTASGTNASGTAYIAYCFTDVKGFSKFGSYTGNASTDGPFVYTGFKPAFVITKNASSTQGWYLLDNKRNPSNDMGKTLFPQDSAAEFDYGVNPSNFDMLSNGFKIRQTGANNVSGETIIYMAFAENPLVTTGKIPATAR